MDWVPGLEAAALTAAALAVAALAAADLAAADLSASPVVSRDTLEVEGHLAPVQRPVEAAALVAQGPTASDLV